ncbi:MAG: RsmE family RNA methyltransferase [Terriglobales bacterium]
MSARLFIAEALAPDRALVRGAEARHLAVVLRAHPGQEFDLAIAGQRFRAAVAAAAPEAVEFRDLRPLPAPAVRRQLTLLAAIFRFERFEWMIEKATEMGAAAIQPVVAARTAPHLARAAAARQARWERLALNAAQQARRIAPPRILPVMNWRVVLAAAETAPEESVLLSEHGDAPPLAQLIQGAGAARLAVGPEGGWSEEEHDAALQAGFAAASLGPLILRAETAAIAALALWLLA